MEEQYTLVTLIPSLSLCEHSELLRILSPGGAKAGTEAEFPCAWNVTRPLILLPILLRLFTNFVFSNRNNKLLGTSASLLGARALLVGTRS